MNSQDAIDLGREALIECLMIGSPILIAGLVIGLVIGMLQAMTQVHDQTVSFVPKLLCMCLIIALLLPWLSERMIDYTRQQLETPATSVVGDDYRGFDASRPSGSPSAHESYYEEPDPDQVANNSQPAALVSWTTEIPQRETQGSLSRSIQSSMPAMESNRTASMPMMTPPVSSMPRLQGPATGIRDETASGGAFTAREQSDSGTLRR